MYREVKRTTDSAFGPNFIFIEDISPWNTQWAGKTKLLQASDGSTASGLNSRNETIQRQGSPAKECNCVAGKQPIRESEKS